ncbi:carbohydrate binding domain-containing protein [Litoribacillus peritrichatus]|uniref:Metalloendopeptidase Mep72 n=1 Tax=Litoribacillus peritrichatus TaxID=718191 RepID=A0ABP7N4F8_9GAMM
MKKFSRATLAAVTLMSGSVVNATEVIDVLVLYVDEATQTSNGQDIDARVAAYIEFSNQAYQNSEVDMKLRLVGIERIEDNYTYVNGENLDALRTNRNVAKLRQQYGADLVSLINLRQPMQGGYVCGIGYVPQGNEQTETLYSNSSSVGFSLVGVDCGYNTFTHELGHNMSLGHSYEQNSEGGIFSWARGHGEYGVFSTIMAYPQAFGTNNQLQQLSNPDHNKCENRACGVDASLSRGADAVGNLEITASQVAAFVPAVDTGGGDNGGDLPVCNKPELEGNLIINGDFTSLENWQSFFNDANLSLVETVADCGKDLLLSVNGRQEFYGGPFQDLTNVIESGYEYQVKAKLGIEAGASRDNVRMALQIKDSSGTHYQYLPSMSVTDNGLSQYDEIFKPDIIGDLQSIGLLIYGPQSGTDFLVDEVILSQTGVKEAPTLLVDEGFENGTTGWGAYFTTNLALSRSAKEGNYSLVSTVRENWYSGPGYNVHGLLEQGKTYQVSVDVYLESDQRSRDSAQIWLYYVDNTGGHWTRLAQKNVSMSQWNSLETEFTVSGEGTITQMRLHVFGPQPSTDVYIDNLSVK